MKPIMPFLGAAGGAAGSMLAFEAFGRLTWTLALAIVAAAALGGMAMFGLSRIRPRGD
jgi:hypothetical protein